jgi:hypothetical protein
VETTFHEFMYVTGVKNSVYRIKKFPIWAGAFFPKTPEKALIFKKNTEICWAIHTIFSHNSFNSQH